MTTKGKKSTGRKKFHSLQTKLLILLFAVMLLLGLETFGYFSSCLKNVYESQARLRLADLLQLSSTNVENQIDSVEQMSVAILIDNVVQKNLDAVNKGEMSMGEVRNSIAVSVRKNVFVLNGVRSAIIHSMSGESIEIGTYFITPPEFDLTQEEIIQANGGALWAVSEDGKYICLSRAILSTEKMLPIGWMQIICDGSLFDAELHTGTENGQGQIYLLDQDGQILSASDSSVKAQKFSCSIEDLGNWQAEDIRNDSNQTTLSALFRPVQGKSITDPATAEKSYFRISDPLTNGWRLVACVPWNSYYASLFALIIQIGIFMLIIFGVASVLVHMGIRKMAEPIGELIHQMNQFGDGDLTARTNIKTNDEFAQIGEVYNRMADKIQDQKEHVFKLELANREAQIEFLKMQINPHFLYNSLDTMSWMAYMNGDEAVSDMSVAMARLLRASIQRENFIPVSQELSIVQDYLKIQRYRFGDKIIANIDIDPDITSCTMPGFILQPIIENSIIHGLEGKENGGEVKVSVKRLDHTIYFCVSDNGLGMDQEELEQLLARCKEEEGDGQSIGLRNVYRRLHLIYRNDCEFQIESEQNVGTTISFQIPIQLYEEGGENAGTTAEGYVQNTGSEEEGT